jgi:hypothetical protein
LCRFKTCFRFNRELYLYNEGGDSVVDGGDGGGGGGGGGGGRGVGVVQHPVGLYNANPIFPIAWKPPDFFNP